MSKLKVSYQKTALLDSSRVAEDIERLRPCLEHLRAVRDRGGYDAPEASVNLGYDDGLRREVKELTEKLASPNLKYVFVIGIGGSNLGTMAVYQALRGTLDAYTSKKPKLIFLDTNGAALLRDAVKLAGKVREASQVAVCVVTKSGGTTETLANFEIIYAKLREKLGDGAKERVVAITDGGSNLWEAAQQAGFHRLAMPKMVGGRYSVFSAVGLLPLAFAGFDIEALHKGSRSMVEQSFSPHISENPALISAIATYEHLRADKNIANTFLFNAELEMVGRWYRQLMGESVGKEHDAEGNVVHAGMTPTFAVGSTDLHSMAQLYLGGPRDKFHTFVSALKGKARANVLSALALPGMVADIEGKNTNEIMRAIMGGVLAAFEQEGIPFITIEMQKIDEEALGELLQMKMMEMIMLANLMNVNAFDQPNVEAYKEETRQLLAL